MLRVWLAAGSPARSAQLQLTECHAWINDDIDDMTLDLQPVMYVWVTHTSQVISWIASTKLMQWQELETDG